MRNDVLVIKNISREGPGLLDRVLREHEITYDLVDLGQDQPFPSAADYRAVIVFGGPDSANDTTPKMQAELAQIKTVVDRGIPYLGICLGMQVLVKAAGGTVIPAAQKEVGFISPTGQPYTVTLTDVGKADPLFAELSAELGVFHLHGETVELADGMQLLATGAGCRNQIVKVGPRAYGIQSHFELIQPMLQDWVGADPDLQPIGGDKLLAEFARQHGTYTVTGLTLFRNFLKVAELVF